MAIYHAVVSGNYIQQNIRTGQLLIYETKKQAKANCPASCNVIAIKVKKAKSFTEGMAE